MEEKYKDIRIFQRQSKELIRRHDCKRHYGLHVTRQSNGKDYFPTLPLECSAYTASHVAFTDYRQVCLYSVVDDFRSCNVKCVAVTQLA